MNVPAARSSTLPICVSAGCIFAAMAARGFDLPLRVDELGGDKVAVGLLFSIGTITAAGLSLPAGFVGDRVGKGPLLVGAVVLSGVAQLGLGLSTSVGPLFVFQALGGMGAGAAQTALMAVLVDVVPPLRLGRAMGWYSLAIQSGFLAGPGAAGIALRWLDLRTELIVSAAFFAVALVLTAAWIRAGRARTAKRGVVATLRVIGRRRAFWIASVTLLGATVTWGTLQAYLPLFGKEHLGLPETQVGYLIAILAVVNGLSRIPAGRLVDRLPRKETLIIAGLALYAVSFAVLPHLTGFWAATLVLGLAMPVVAAVYLALGVVYGNLSTAEARGVTMGVYGTILYLGLGFGPAALGPVIQAGGYAAGFTACAAAGVALAAVAAALRTVRPQRRPDERAAA